MGGRTPIAHSVTGIAAPEGIIQALCRAGFERFNCALALWVPYCTSWHLPTRRRLNGPMRRSCAQLEREPSHAIDFLAPPAPPRFDWRLTWPVALTRLDLPRTWAR